MKNDLDFIKYKEKVEQLTEMKKNLNEQLKILKENRLKYYTSVKVVRGIKEGIMHEIPEI
jgi:hypothetical protein